MDDDLAGVGQAADHDPGGRRYHRNIYIILVTMMVRTRPYHPWVPCSRLREHEVRWHTARAEDMLTKT